MRLRAAHDQAGSSLVESTVAVVLLVGVLAPAAASVYGLAAQRHNEVRVVALALAQRHLEAALHERQYTTATTTLDGGAWRIERHVAAEGRRVLVTVRVYRHDAAEPSAELTTMRRL